MTRKTDPRTARLPVPAHELPAFTPVPRKCNRHDGWTPEAHTRWLDTMSPRTRAAWDAFERAQAEDAAHGYKWWEDPDHPLHDDAQPPSDTGEDEAIPLPPPGWRQCKVEVPDNGPVVRRLKDEGWE